MTTPQSGDEMIQLVIREGAIDSIVDIDIAAVN
jgi:hypothetical protein